MIKFKLRRNLIYPGQYVIWSVVRDFLSIMIRHFLYFSNSLVYGPTMFLGEFIAGAIIHLYLRKVETKKQEKKEQFFMSIKLIRNEEDDTYYYGPKDNKIKIIFLIFIAAFLDIVIFYIDTGALSKLKVLSSSISMRLYGFATIAASFTYVYTLKLPLYKHHKFSLIIIGICLIVIIVTEYFFQKMDTTMDYIKFTFALLFIIASQILVSIQDSIEKYLFEYNYMSPFVVLMYEGLFGFALTFFFFFTGDYFHDIIKIYNKKTIVGEKILLIFLLFLYMILSGLKNIFRVVTIKIYSPMESILTYYIINPLYFPYYVIKLGDFKDKYKDKINGLYLALNTIIAVIISLCGCIYVEFIILYCCGLESGTHYQISERANNLQIELTKIDDETNIIHFEDENSIISQSDKESENI